MDYTFTRPLKKEDFEQRLAEIAMKLDADFGNFHNASELAFSLFQKAAENMRPEEVPQFLKLVGIFKLFADYAQTRQEEYDDLSAELASYTTGNFVLDEENFECIYLDHRNFAQRYPNYKPNDLLPK